KRIMNSVFVPLWLIFTGIFGETGTLHLKEFRTQPAVRFCSPLHNCLLRQMPEPPAATLSGSHESEQVPSMPVSIYCLLSRQVQNIFQLRPVFVMLGRLPQPGSPPLQSVVCRKQAFHKRPELSDHPVDTTILARNPLKTRNQQV